jgi:CheY-like chemotaxis protein
MKENQPKKKISGKPLHILVVDDDKILRENLGRILEIGGYRVTGADNGIVALNFLEGAPIDLVITDVNMPQMDGLELVEKMAERFPHVPALVVSGSRNSAERFAGKILPNVRKHLRKPVAIDALISAVVEIFTHPQ